MEGVKCLRRSYCLSATVRLFVTVYRNFVFLARDPPTRNFGVNCSLLSDGADVFASVSVFKTNGIHRVTSNNVLLVFK